MLLFSFFSTRQIVFETLPLCLSYAAHFLNSSLRFSKHPFYTLALNPILKHLKHVKVSTNPIWKCPNFVKVLVRHHDAKHYGIPTLTSWMLVNIGQQLAPWP